jgi:amino acid transporter
VSRVHPKRHTLAAAILLVRLWSCVLAVAGTYQQILTAVGFVAHLLLSLAVAAVIVLRFKEPNLARPYRVPGYPVTPVLFLAISAWYLINLLSTRLGPSLIGIGSWVKRHASISSWFSVVLWSAVQYPWDVAPSGRLKYVLLAGGRPRSGKPEWI